MSGQNKPNILFIFTDQQRWDTMAAYGNHEISTPNMDRLASRGIIFDNAITPCPLCLPARTCAMTGYPAGRLKSLENSKAEMSDNRDTIAGYLGKNGYYCQAIGKMHFSNNPYEESYGMDSMILSEETRGLRQAASREDIVLDDYDRYLAARHIWGWDKPPEIGYNEIKPVINYLKKEDHVTQWCGDETVRWLKEKRPKKRPFFLWTSFVKPHPPFDCPAHLADFYTGRVTYNPWISERDKNNPNPYFRRYREQNEFCLYSEEAQIRTKEYYYANLTFIDEQIGRILDTLESEGLSENTVIIFTSDHGELLGDHLLWYKCFGYEGSMHIPLIISWPSVLPVNIRRNEQVSLLDLFPTVMNLAGVTVPGMKRPGRDLLVFDGNRCEDDIGVSEILYPPKYMLHIRTNHWKYLYYQNGGYEELYDLKSDPHELHDLSENPAYAAVKSSLVSRGISWIKEYDNPEYALDGGQLKKAPYTEPAVSKGRPFSRMPWDSRIPAGYGINGIFFDNQDRSDWSFFIRAEDLIPRPTGRNKGY